MGAMMSATSAAYNPAAPALLQIHQLSLTTASHGVLRGVDMTIYGGERVALLGPSGTGKSLLARALTGILPQDVECTGRITLNGYDITQRHPALRPSSARVSMVDQDTATALSPLHTLGQQLMMVCAGAGQKGCGIRWHAESLLDQVGVSRSVMGRYPAELSGGQRQRVCIALALACNTSLLVADEPTSALDAVSQQHVLNALSGTVPQQKSKALFGMSLLNRATNDEESDSLAGAAIADEHQRSKALLFITHDLRAAQQLCDRALVLCDGKIVEDAPMATLLAAPQHEVTQRMVAALQCEQQRLGQDTSTAATPLATASRTP